MLKDDESLLLYTTNFTHWPLSMTNLGIAPLVLCINILVCSAVQFYFLFMCLPMTLLNYKCNYITTVPYITVWGRGGGGGGAWSYSNVLLCVIIPINGQQQIF